MRLSVVIEIRNEIDAEKRRLEKLKAAATATTKKLDGLPRSKSHSSKVEIAALIVDCENRLDRLGGELVDQSFKLINEIYDRVQSEAATVLCQRYVNLKTFSEISASMNLSHSYISRLHKNGVKEFENNNQ